MRLIRHLNEQDFTTIIGDTLRGKGDKYSPTKEFMMDCLNVWIPRIKKDCKPIVSIMRKTKKFLWRGMAGDNEGFVIKTPRQDRNPTDTPTRVHKEFDRQYKLRYGWKPRSEGVFVSNKEVGTTGYGPKHVIFPVGRFQYTWALDINDFFIWSRHETKKAQSDEEIKFRISEVIERYNNNKRIDQFMNKSIAGEMMIKCEKYYAINYEFVQNSTAQYPGFESDFQDAFFK